MVNIELKGGVVKEFDDGITVMEVAITDCSTLNLPPTPTPGVLHSTASAPSCSRSSSSTGSMPMVQRCPLAAA